MIAMNERQLYAPAATALRMYLTTSQTSLEKRRRIQSFVACDPL